MKKIFFLALIILIVRAFEVPYAGIKNPDEPIFCGREGKLYNISEPDMWEEIVKKARKTNETFFYNLLKKKFKEAFINNMSLPICNSFRVRKFEPIYVVKKDIYANGVLLYKKGYKFNILEKETQLSAVKPIIYFGRLDNNLSKEIGLNLIKKYKRAIFAVTKGNLENLAKKYPYQIAKANNRLLTSFKVNCLNSIVIFGNKNVYVLEIPENKLKKEELNKLYNVIDEYYQKFYKGLF